AGEVVDRDFQLVQLAVRAVLAQLRVNRVHLGGQDRVGGNRDRQDLRLPAGVHRHPVRHRLAVDVGGGRVVAVRVEVVVRAGRHVRVVALEERDTPGLRLGQLWLVEGDRDAGDADVVDLGVDRLLDGGAVVAAAHAERHQVPAQCGGGLLHVPGEGGAARVRALDE